MAISESEFKRFSDFIHQHTGIKMPADKKTMLEVRLQKRLRALGMASFREYAEFVFSDVGMKQELVQMVDVVTTNKTDFFREPAHFSFLTQMVLPELLNGQGRRAGDSLNLWSAGCSSGEEPYTLAMVLHHYATTIADCPFSIIGTDICTNVLEKARRAVYDSGQIEPIPLNMRRSYLLRSKDRTKGLFRVTPQLRSCVSFRRLNFMDDDFAISESMDIIFCRNVIIYFDRKTQEQLFKKFCTNLRPGGFIFIGHSETLSGMAVPLEQVASTVYRKTA
jgi:chemotaxis protein methyltransferase CheR